LTSYGFLREINVGKSRHNLEKVRALGRIKTTVPRISGTKWDNKTMTN